MKPYLSAINVMIGLAIFDPFAIAIADDCTPAAITVARPYLIESSGLEDAFALLDAVDCVGALNRFEQSAHMGNLAAQNNVGVIFEIGLGLHADLRLARRWYQIAAQGGLAEAQWNLAAVILAPHQNVSISDGFRPLPPAETAEEIARYREALLWSFAAAENGHPVASEGVRRLSEALPESEVRVARSVARRWIFSDSSDEFRSKIGKARDLAGLVRLSEMAEIMVPTFVAQYVNVVKLSIQAANPSLQENDEMRERWLVYLDHLKIAVEEEAEEGIDNFVDRMAYIYADAFSEKEMEILIDVYENPVMKKMLDLMPELMKAGQVVGEQWGREVADKAIQRFMDKHALPLTSE